jgi:hypothetical protein
VIVITALVVGLVFGVGVGVILGYALALADQRPGVASAAIAPEPPRVPIVTPPARTVAVALVEEAGRHHAFTIPATARRPRLTWPDPSGALHVFQASHQDASGTWIYRETGVEPAATVAS